MKLRIVMKGLLLGSAALAILTAIIVAITVLTTPASVEEGESSELSVYSSAALTHGGFPVRTRRVTPPPTNRLDAATCNPIVIHNGAATPAPLIVGAADDDGSHAIFTALQSTNHTVRMQAIAAAKQLDGPEGVTQLREIAAQMDDPQEKVALLDAIDYVNLPSLGDLAIARRMERQARGLPPTRVAAAHREARNPSSRNPRLRVANPARRTTPATASINQIENGINLEP